MLTETRKAELVNLCQRLVQQKSYSGQENHVAAVIKNFAQNHVFDEILTDKYGNVILSIKGSQPGPKVLLDGHIDTVPVNEKNWSVNPYSGEIKDGKIFGRGSSDMKGAVSAMLTAAVCMAEDTNKEFPGTIYISCSVHEECFEGIATREVSRIVNPDYVIIGEATNLQLNCGQRGRAEIVLETFGKPAHSSNPSAGANAVYMMSDLIQRINKLTVPEHPVLGKGILELTDIKSTPYPGASVVPSYCKATYDRRLLVGETKETVLKPLQMIIDEWKTENPQFQAKVSFAYGEELCYTGERIGAERFFPAWVFDETEPFVQAAWQSLKDHQLNLSISHYSFCTNGSHFAGEKAIPTIGFGPSFEHLAHIDDEYIEIEQLEKAALGYYALMTAFTNLKTKQSVLGGKEDV
ncbi:YgeY family selenium metabolism-linked hydrolase [Peribacillus tepidiphilus]|uniref:YgeY family selenium metabolism-linked hydrolase n=1 Tax=Peribacillus tepidiphilus TaxID=2652445 RepID=UPI0012921AA4|nr:YgeY family selenium metabolism-linked hydrolase [Peribacillus tepidiphilus]